MSNPHPTKQQPRNGSMHTDSARGILNMTNAYVKRTPRPGEAPPACINLMALDDYEPKPWPVPVR